MNISIIACLDRFASPLHHPSWQLLHTSFVASNHEEYHRVEHSSFGVFKKLCTCLASRISQPPLGLRCAVRNTPSSLPLINEVDAVAIVLAGPSSSNLIVKGFLWNQLHLLAF